MCCCNVETVGFLLLNCDVAFGLWSREFVAFGVLWVLPGSVADLLFGWWNWLGKHSSDIWNTVPLYLMWNLWRERNCRTFEDEEQSTAELK